MSHERLSLVREKIQERVDATGAQAAAEVEVLTDVNYTERSQRKLRAKQLLAQYVEKNEQV